MIEEKVIVKYGVLAGVPEIIGERCSDGGTCHHRCNTHCFRKECCVPLSGSGLNDDWSISSNDHQHDSITKITIDQVLKAYDYAADHPDGYLRGTTNWCAAVAYSLNKQVNE